jgi:dTDP-4-amino-4,6-dideoxygalactose transaminase
MHISLTSNGIRQEDIASAIDVKISGKLTIGKKFLKFESEVTKYLGVKYFGATTFLLGCHHDFSKERVAFLVDTIDKILHSI